MSFGPIRQNRPYVSTQIKKVTTNAFTVINENLILVNFAGAVTITLPNVYTTGPGSPIPPISRQITVTDASGAAGANKITINPGATGGALISGQSSFVLGYNFGTVTFTFDGVNWEAEVNPSINLPLSQFTSSNMAASVIPSGVLSGAGDVFVAVTAATPGTCTTRTAAQLFGDIPGCYPGLAYSLRMVNTSANTLTFAAGTNVTFTGTSTVATNVTRDYCVTFGNGTGNNATVVFQSVGSGTSP